MLTLKVTDQGRSPERGPGVTSTQGFMHRHEFEDSKVADAKLQFVPFWVIPASASTTYQYQAVAASVGATVGTMAAGALLGRR